MWSYGIQKSTGAGRDVDCARNVDDRFGRAGKRHGDHTGGGGASAARIHRLHIRSDVFLVEHRLRWRGLRKGKHRHGDFRYGTIVVEQDGQSRPGVLGKRGRDK